MQNTITLNNTNYTTQQIVQHFNTAQANTQQTAQNTASAVQAMLANTKTTFAHVVQVTQVKTAAAHKQQTILKVSSVNVMLSTCANTYTNAVKNSAAKQATNSTNNVNNFKASKASFTRTSCAAIAHSNKTQALQLVYLAFNNVKSANKTYYICANTMQVLSKEQVAQYLTASAAKQLLNKQTTVTNKTHNIVHTVHTRSVNMHNVISVTANKTTVNNMLQTA